MLLPSGCSTPPMTVPAGPHAAALAGLVQQAGEMTSEIALGLAVGAAGCDRHADGDGPGRGGPPGHPQDPELRSPELRSPE
jgi:hypothetical protein